MALGGPSFTAGSSNDPAIGVLSTTSWVVICPSFANASALRRGGARGRRWTGGVCRNADNEARVVQLRLNDGVTQTTFREQTLEPGDSWVWTDEIDGLDLARAEAVEARSTTSPTTALSVVTNFADG